MPTPIAQDDPRVAIPLFSAREVARYLRVPSSTMRNWVRGYEYPSGNGTSTSRAIVTSVPPSRPSNATIPFVGLAEALVVAGFRQKRLSMQKVRAALAAIDQEVGLAYVLANKTLYTDGASILWDYARKIDDDDIRQLVEPHAGQTVFVPAVEQYLRLVTYDSKWWASQIELPAFQPTRVVVDLRREYGRPILDKQRLSVATLLERWYISHDTINDIAMDLELDPGEVENVIRAAWRPAAA